MSVLPEIAPDGIVMFPISKCGPTDEAGEVYTFSPASVNKPFWLKSIQTLVQLV